MATAMHVLGVRCEDGALRTFIGQLESADKDSVRLRRSGYSVTFPLASIVECYAIDPLATDGEGLSKCAIPRLC